MGGRKASDFAGAIGSSNRSFGLGLFIVDYEVIIGRLKGKPVLVTTSLAIVSLLFLAVSSGLIPSSAGLDRGSVSKGNAASEGAGQGSLTSKIFLPFISKPAEPSWPMAGANPQRTSWTSEEVRGKLKPVWYRPIEPYILPRVQVIAAKDTLYVSTARGLYALDAATGGDKWVYPTEMPLGHSPTIDKGIAYVGSFDRRLHALDAETGQRLWTFEAGAGFDTNPLVVGDKVYAGNRDGCFYAIYTSGPKTGQLVWKFETQGPIHFSAAYQGGIIYFASDDMHAYALNAQTGDLVWKSAKLPAVGFHSWWPVVYEDYVILAGSKGYRENLGPDPLNRLERMDIYPNIAEDPKGTLVGPLGTVPGNWVPGTPTIDASQPTVTSNGSTTAILDYFEEKPWRRTYIVLNRGTGDEYTTDFDQDGRPEYPPVLWFGTRGADNRYPPIVGRDNVLYQTNNYMSNNAIPGGHISGWQVGSTYISVISSDWGAVDEPHAYAAGGNYIYWNLCCDRQFGSIDISRPNTEFADRYRAGIRPPTKGGLDGNREWMHFSYDLPDLIPGYNIMTYVSKERYDAPEGGVYRDRNGSYGWHGNLNPPVPYGGMVYMHRSNAIIAFAPQAGDPVLLPLAETVTVQDDIAPMSLDELHSRLEAEVERILAKGHLRPGYLSTGIFDQKGMSVCGDDLTEYWHHPGDTITALAQALPHLPNGLQGQTKDYLQAEFSDFPPYQYNHIGWNQGAPRDQFELPPEVTASLNRYDPRVRNSGFLGWDLAPHSFYAMWKYAQLNSDEAQNIYEASQDKLESPPTDAVLMEMPHVHNAYIAGYWGFLELEKLAGYPETTAVRAELDRLLALRVTTFSKDAPDVFFTDSKKRYCRTLNVARNFMYLTPELGQYLHDNALGEVREALLEYQEIAPYWFVSQAEVAFGEGTITPLYDYHTLFQAKALIMREPRDELTKYLDVPAFPVGDLFYLQNLVAAIEAGGN